jgi:hypothetical protein
MEQHEVKASEMAASDRSIRSFFMGGKMLGAMMLEKAAARSACKGKYRGGKR